VAQASTVLIPKSIEAGISNHGFKKKAARKNKSNMPYKKEKNEILSRTILVLHPSR